MLTHHPKIMENDLPQPRAIKVKMLMFGPLAERIGSREMTVSLLHGSTANDLAERFELSEMLSSGLRIAIDGKVGADSDEPLNDGSEVAFLPPVSGG